MSSVNKYRLLCTTDSAYKYSWGISTPTTCPDNSGHSIDSSTIAVVEIVSDDVQKVLPQNASKTKGHYAVQTINISLDNSTDPVTATYTWPFDVEIKSGKLSTKNSDDGDIIECWVEVGIIGVVGANASSGDSFVYVNSTVLDYSEVGFYVTFGADTTRYLIKSKDVTNSKLTLATTLSSNVAAMAYVYLIPVVLPPTFEIDGNSGLVVIGTETSQGTYLPANKPMKIKYVPVAARARKVRGLITYLF